MTFAQRIKFAFGRKPLQRGYRDIVAVGGQNSDWILQSISDDADLWQNAYALTARVDDLFKTNPLYIKYRELIWANVFGSDGIMLRMKIQETEDRVVYAKDEKIALVAHEARINRVREWASRQSEIRNPKSEIQSYRAFKLADALEARDLDSVLRGTALISVGSPDLYANKVIEGGWGDWQRKEYCDLRRTRNYLQTRQLRLIMAVRQGDFFIRLIRDPSINKYGFTQQLISAQWVDRFYNETLANGNVVIMGIEYQATPYGLGHIAGFHLIKRVPQDWQYSAGGLFGYGSSGKNLRQRIGVEEIIHYARPVDADATRPAPWVASTIAKGRQLDQYELAEVIAAREAACKTGYLWSDVNPEGGMAGLMPDPTTGLLTNALAPGETGALKWGVKYQERNPTHPNGNFETFRKGMVRSITSGMPAADYNTLANDLENINFSAGRLGRLDTNEMSKLIQRFDIDTAERPIFEAWLEMALITGAVPLPLVKLQKFNKPVFQGRRWAQVDEIKAETASAMRIANNKSSWAIECAEDGKDFEESMMEKAENLMLMEELNIDPTLTVQGPAKLVQDPEGGTNLENNAASTEKKPAAKKERNATTDVVAAAVPGGSSEETDMSPQLFLRGLETIMARTPQQAGPITVNVPEIKIPAPVIDMSGFQMPEQKAPVVNVQAARAADVNIMVPKQLPPVIQVSPTPVTIENKIDVPMASSVKIKRDKEGKMTEAEIERK